MYSYSRLGASFDIGHAANSSLTRAMRYGMYTALRLNEPASTRPCCFPPWCYAFPVPVCAPVSPWFAPVVWPVSTSETPPTHNRPGVNLDDHAPLPCADYDRGPGAVSMSNPLIRGSFAALIMLLRLYE